MEDQERPIKKQPCGHPIDNRRDHIRVADGFLVLRCTKCGDIYEDDQEPPIKKHPPACYGEESLCKIMGDQDRPIVEREFEKDEKGRTIAVCALCGEHRPRKTRGEGRCCMRTTHDWRPVSKKPDIGHRVVFNETGDPGVVIAKSWDSDGIILRVHFDDMSPGTWGEYYSDKFLLEVNHDA